MARNRRALVAAGFAILAVALLHDATLSGGALFRRDLSVVWYPMVEAFVRCIAAGAWPVWDPWRGFGQPLLADARAAVLYPPTWLNLIVPPWRYQTWFAAGHLWLGACGAWALSRRLGSSPAGAFVAGAVWMGSGPVVSLAGQFHHLAGAAWMPVILAAGLRALGTPDGRSIALLAGALALQVFAGSPDYSAVTGLVLLLFVVAQLATRREAPRALGAVVVGGALGLGLSAAQWLPTLALARGSTRWDQPLELATTWALAPVRLVELVFPVPWAALGRVQSAIGDREPYLASIYCGALAVAMAAAAFGPWRRLLALTLAGGLLALGSHTPLYDGLLALLPPLRLLRFPEKVIVVSALGLALLAGLGFDALASERPGARRRALLAGILASAGGALAWLASGSLAPARVLGLVLLALLVSRLRLPPLRRAALLAALVVVDLVASHHRLNPTAPVALFTTRPSPLATLGPIEAARVYVYDYTQRFPAGAAERPGPERLALARWPEGWRRDAALVFGALDYMLPPTAERWGVRGSFDGDIVDLYARPLKRLVERLREVEGDAGHLRLLRLASVSHVLALHDASWSRELRPLATLPGLFREPIRVFGVPDPMPNVYAVAGLRPASDAAAAELLTGAEFDPRREIVVADAAALPPGSVDARIDATRSRPDRLEMDVRLDGAGYLVMTESFDPGWSARLDGQPAPLLRANLAFRALAVPAGEHRVELRYRPPGFALGASLSGASALVLLALAWRKRA